METDEPFETLTLHPSSSVTAGQLLQTFALFFLSLRAGFSLHKSFENEDNPELKDDVTKVY